MCSNICFISTINRGKLENCEKNIRSTAIFEVRFLENMFCLKYWALSQNLPLLWNKPNVWNLYKA